MPDSPELNMFLTARGDVTVLLSLDNKFKNICLELKATTIQISHYAVRFRPLRLLFSKVS